MKELALAKAFAAWGETSVMDEDCATILTVRTALHVRVTQSLLRQDGLRVKSAHKAKTRPDAQF
eukprot:3778347-Pleurochrysis_carterae.AAC.1